MVHIIHEEFRRKMNEDIKIIKQNSVYKKEKLLLDWNRRRRNYQAHTIGSYVFFMPIFVHTLVNCFFEVRITEIIDNFFN